MEWAILQSFQNVLKELSREDAEVKAAQLTKDLTARGLQSSDGLRFVTREHLEPYLNEFQISSILEEWEGSRTDTAAQPSSQLQEDVDIRWETIWELDEVAKNDPGELKLALIVEKRHPSNSAELLLINHLVGKAKAKLRNLPKPKEPREDLRAARCVMEAYVIHCVRKFPDSFNDQCGSSKLGYSRFLKHAKDQFDNRRDKSGTGERKRHSGIGKENVIIEMPVKCVLGLREDQWHDTSVPEMESEKSLLEKKEMLKKLSKVPRKNLDVSKVRELFEVTYASQRKDMLKTHKTIKDFQSKRKKKSTEDDNLPEITDLTSEWPFLFRPEIILHVNRLYGNDLEKSFSLFMDIGGKQLLEFLVVHHGIEGKILEKAKEKSFDMPELLALLILIAQFFKEKVDCFIIEAEDSLQLEAVQDLPSLPATPCIVSCGPSLFQAKKYILCMDKYPFYAVRSFRLAFYIVFSCFYVFHVDFPARFGLALEYFQREVLDINPEKGTKRAEGSSSSPVSIKILDLTTKCHAYHAALNRDKPNEDIPNEESSPMNLSVNSNISSASSK